MSRLLNLIQGTFSSDNPFLARLWDFFQTGRVTLVPYSFTADWNPLAASAVNSAPTTTMTIDPSIDFLLLQAHFVAYPTTGIQTTPQATPNMLLNLTEKSGANVFSDVAHHVGLWTGNTQSGAGAYNLPFPRLIKGNNEIQARLTDNGGTATRCFLGFEGIRVTYVNADRREVFPFLAF